MKNLEVAALILVIIGGINWGLVGAFKFNLVDSIFGEGSALSRIVYVLVGLAAVYALVPLVGRLSDGTKVPEQ